MVPMDLNSKYWFPGFGFDSGTNLQPCFILNFQGCFFIMPCLAIGMQGTSHSPPSSGSLRGEQSVSYVSKRVSLGEFGRISVTYMNKRIKIYIYIYNNIYI